LGDIYFPWLKIILEPFNDFGKTVVSIIILVILLFWAFWRFPITKIHVNAVTASWQKPAVTAALPSVHFDDTYLVSRCPEDAIERHKDLLKNPDGISAIFIKGTAPGLSKSDYANEVGVCLSAFLNQSKQDDRPVDAITISVYSEYFNVISSVYRAIEALCGSENTDCINQINEQLIQHSLLSGRNSFETEKTLKFLFTKLYEFLTRRNSHAVVILYSWGDSDNMDLFRHCIPRSARTELGL